MSKIKQTEIPMELTTDNLLKIAVEQGVIENEFNWKLVREHDGLINQSKEIKWLEWNEEGRVRQDSEYYEMYGFPYTNNKIISIINERFNTDLKIIFDCDEPRHESLAYPCF